jgi:hypothetical protein
MKTYIFALFCLFASQNSIAVVSFTKCEIEQGKEMFCHVPSNDLSKAHAICTGNPSIITGHPLNQGCNPTFFDDFPGHVEHCLDFDIESEEDLALCNGGGSTDSSLEVCNVGIKHLNGIDGYDDFITSAGANSGPTFSSHDYMTFSYEELTDDQNPLSEEDLVIEASNFDDFNTAFSMPTSLNRRINNMTINLNSEKRGSAFFVDFCYINGGKGVEKLELEYTFNPSLINTELKLYCTGDDLGGSINLAEYPSTFMGMEGAYFLNFAPNFEPTACIVRLFGYETGTSSRDYPFSQMPVNIDFIKFSETDNP